MSRPTVSILLVEDDADDEFLIRKQMTEAVDAGFTYLMARAGTLEEAKDRLARESFDLILLDLMLPDSSGIETLVAVRDGARNIPVVVLTGLGDTALGVKAMGLGAQEYLVKGTLTAKDIKRTIRYALERSKLVSQFENVLQSAPDGMIVLDAGSVVRFVNPAAERIFCQPADQLLGREFPYPATANRTTELLLPMPDGNRRRVEMRVSRMEWNGLPACLATFRDVTELKKLEELRLAIKSQSRLHSHR